MSQIPLEGMDPPQGFVEPRYRVVFKVKCVPPTANHQSKKIVSIKPKGGVGKPFLKLADSDELTAARKALMNLFIPHQIPNPVPGPVSLVLTFYWPFRSNTPQYTLKRGREWKTTAPDADNLAKTVTDVLKLLCFLRSDAEVAELVVRKFYGGKPGIVVKIRTLPEDAYQTAIGGPD